ncbi:MAG: hypothetical protein K2L83_04935 [Muribaculaceae bacterium]|nr:hypothetical protein [Muribaculaceae bacterium]
MGRYNRHDDRRDDTTSPDTLDALLMALGHAAGFLIALLLLILIGLLGGCSRRVTGTVETVYDTRVDTVYAERTVTRVDSVVVERVSRLIVRDSIAPRLDSLGAISGYDHYHYEQQSDSESSDRARFLAALDSLSRVSAQTTDRATQTTIEVAAPLSWWQKTLMAVGGIVVMTAIAVGIYWLNHFIRGQPG